MSLVEVLRILKGAFLDDKSNTVEKECFVTIVPGSYEIRGFYRVLSKSETKDHFPRTITRCIVICGQTLLWSVKSMIGRDLTSMIGI